MISSFVGDSGASTQANITLKVSSNGYGYKKIILRFEHGQREFNLSPEQAKTLAEALRADAYQQLSEYKEIVSL